MFRRIAIPLLILAALFGLTAVSFAACGDDDDGGVEVIDGEPDPEADPDPEAEGTVEPGVVGVKPGDATQVEATLREFAIDVTPKSVAPGSVYFLVENAGPADPHEFVIIKTDLAPDALPVGDDGRVPEDDVEMIDEIEPYAPGSSASITVDLEAGAYVLICNIAEEEDGELESHYQLGMRTAFTVE